MDPTCTLYKVIHKVNKLKLTVQDVLNQSYFAKMHVVRWWGRIASTLIRNSFVRISEMIQLVYIEVKTKLLFYPEWLNHQTNRQRGWCGMKNDCWIYSLSMLAAVESSKVHILSVYTVKCLFCSFRIFSDRISSDV